MKNEYYLRRRNFRLFRLLFLGVINYYFESVNLFWMKNEKNGNFFYVRMIISEGIIDK